MRIDIRSFFRTSWAILKETAIGFGDDKIFKLASALAYITISSLAPLLLIVLSVVGWLYGNSYDVQQALFGQIRDLVGREPARQLQQFMQSQALEGSSTWATILGVVLLVVAATLLFADIQDSINTIWQVQPKPSKNSIWLLIRTRLLSLGMIVAVGFLLLVSLILTTVLQILADRIAAIVPGLEGPIIQFAQFTVLFGMITVMFALIFKVLPDAQLRWGDVWGGAIFTAILFLIGKALIGLYLGRAEIGSNYGAAGSLVVLLTWVYYSSVILYLGAEFTWARAKVLGHRIKPASYAVFVEKVPTEHDDLQSAAQTAKAVVEEQKAASQEKK